MKAKGVVVEFFESRRGLFRALCPLLRWAMCGVGGTMRDDQC